MRRVFADSLYWIALSHQRDQWHAAALMASRALQSVEIVTTQEMLSDFLTAFHHTPRLRSIAARRVHEGSRGFVFSFGSWARSGEKARGKLPEEKPRLIATAASDAVPIKPQPRGVSAVNPSMSRSGRTLSVARSMPADPPTAPKTDRFRFPSDQPASKV